MTEEKKIKVFYDWREAVTALEGTSTVLALGTFDGVHLGHQQLLSRTVEMAREGGQPALFFTFDRHPLSLLCPESAPPLLTPCGEKLARLFLYHPDVVVVQEFNSEFAELSAKDFIDRVLVGLRAKRVAVGFNNTFGKGGQGNPEFLRSHGAALGMEVQTLPPVAVDGQVVGSSVIRGLLREGAVERVKCLLGYPYTIRGTVVRGEGRGHRYGFPTANLAFHPDKLCPPDGVYGVMAKWEGEERKALAAISTQPTFGGHALRLEVFIPNFAGNLYGKELEAVFFRRIRGISTFGSPQALGDQIRRDLAVLENNPGI